MKWFPSCNLYTSFSYGNLIELKILQNMEKVHLEEYIHSIILEILDDHFCCTLSVRKLCIVKYRFDILTRLFFFSFLRIWIFFHFLTIFIQNVVSVTSIIIKNLCYFHIQNISIFQISTYKYLYSVRYFVKVNEKQGALVFKKSIYIWKIHFCFLSTYRFLLNNKECYFALKKKPIVNKQ